MVAGLLGLVAVMWAGLEEPVEERDSEPDEHCDPCKVLWKEWEPGLVEATRKRGRVVWLTFSCDWDATSRVNEFRVLGDRGVLEELGEHRVVLIKADTTGLDPEIVKELKKYGGFVIPKNILMPGDLEEEVVILPELLSREVFLEGLGKVVGE